MFLLLTEMLFSLSHEVPLQACLLYLLSSFAALRSTKAALAALGHLWEHSWEPIWSIFPAWRCVALRGGSSLNHPQKHRFFFSLTWVTKLQAQKPFTACPVLGGEGLAASTYVGRKNLITSRAPSPLACPKMIVKFGKIRVQSHRHLL